MFPVAIWRRISASIAREKFLRSGYGSRVSTDCAAYHGIAQRGRSLRNVFTSMPSSRIGFSSAGEGGSSATSDTGNALASVLSTLYVRICPPSSTGQGNFSLTKRIRRPGRMRVS
jgi:hypothetical protein